MPAILKILGTLCILIAFATFFRHGGNFAKNLPDHSRLIDAHITSGEQQRFCGSPSKDGHPVVVEMVHSEEKRLWLELGADRFSHLCPGIQVKLTAMSDIDAADAIGSDRLKPTLWSPTDEMSLRYLDHSKKRRTDSLPFILETISLIESPLVMLIWQDRLRELARLLREERSDEGQWVRGLCSLIPREPDLTGVPIEEMVPGFWADWAAMLTPLPTNRKGVVPVDRPIAGEPLPSLEELRKWGRVKIRHARPTHDSAGVAALYLAAYDYLLPPKERAVLLEKDEGEKSAQGGGKKRSENELGAQEFERVFAQKKDALRTWLRRCEAGLDAAPKTAQALTVALFNTGPSLYDGVVTYEHLALSFIEKVDANADAMRKLVIVYPQPLLLARHPAVLLDATPEQQAAARRWLQFLLSRTMQEKAIESGFRPVGSEVSIRSYDVERNLFLHLRRHGVLVQPHWTEAPRAEGSLVHELLRLWEEATGRN